MPRDLSNALLDSNINNKRNKTITIALTVVVKSVGMNTNTSSLRDWYRYLLSSAVSRCDRRVLSRYFWNVGNLKRGRSRLPAESNYEFTSDLLAGISEVFRRKHYRLVSVHIQMKRTTTAYARE